MAIRMRFLPVEKLHDPKFWAALVSIDSSEAMQSRLLGIDDGSIGCLNLTWGG